MRRVAFTILVCLCIGCSSHTASPSRGVSTSATETRNDPSSEFCNHPAPMANTSSLSSLLALTHVLVTSASATRDNDLIIPGTRGNPSTTAADDVPGPIVFEHWHVTVGSVLLSIPKPEVDTPAIQPAAQLDVILPFHNADNTSVLTEDGILRLIGLQYIPKSFRPFPVQWQVMFTATSNASGTIQLDCDGGKGLTAVLTAFAAAKRETNGLPLLMKTMTSARRVQNGGRVDSDLELLMKLENPQVSETATSSTAGAATETT